MNIPHRRRALVAIRLSYNTLHVLSKHCKDEGATGAMLRWNSLAPFIERQVRVEAWYWPATNTYEVGLVWEGSAA